MKKNKNETKNNQIPSYYFRRRRRKKKKLNANESLFYKINYNLVYLFLSLDCESIVIKRRCNNCYHRRCNINIQNSLK